MAAPRGSSPIVVMVSRDPAGTGPTLQPPLECFPRSECHVAGFPAADTPVAANTPIRSVVEVSTDDERPRRPAIVLIRHGESVGNATRTISHFRTCGGLSDAGRAQCELLAKRLDRTGELTRCRALCQPRAPGGADGRVRRPGARRRDPHRRAIRRTRSRRRVRRDDVRGSDRPLLAGLDAGGPRRGDLPGRRDGRRPCTPASPPRSTSSSLGTPASWWRSAPTAGSSTWPCASACGCRCVGGSTCSR